MAILDFSTPYQKQKALLAMYGLFIVLSASFLGCWFTAALVSPDIALIGGLMFVMFVSGILGYFTVVIQQAIQEVKIKVVNE
ncbi:MAG: hypothetical protein PHV83_05580 [Bacteroidales bacterium]|nr:hypothetical protein [Bacteroidales bacterium]